MAIRDNSKFGFTVQLLICRTYKLEIPTRAQKYFESSGFEDYLGIAPTIKKAFSELRLKPVKCTTLEKETSGEFLPYNFVLENGATCLVKTSTTKHAMLPSPVVGQAGISTLQKHFGHLSKEKIQSKDDIKSLVWNQIEDMLPIFLDYLFNDYLIIFHCENGNYEYEIIDSSELVEMVWERSRITFTRPNLESWNESNTIKYDGISIAECQVHKNRTFKFRFILPNITRILRAKLENNETFGVSAELAICKAFGLKYPPNLDDRSNDKLVNRIQKLVEEIFKRIPHPIHYIGQTPGDTGPKSKSSIDFVLAHGKKLSLKTNYEKMVCPPIVGQPCMSTFIKEFSGIIRNPVQFNKNDFKKLCMEKTAIMMSIYLHHLMDCDYLLRIKLDRKTDTLGYDLIDGNKEDFVFKQDQFSFTQTLDSWNESNTVKYKGIKLGEFQVHNNRDCLKFRFDWDNLVKIINQ